MILRNLNPKFITTLFLLIVLLLNENVVFSQQPQYTCSEMEEPIVGDWGFSVIASSHPNISATSPWKATSSVSFCTDDMCGSSAYSLAGYYYAQFLYNESDPNTQTSTLWQTVSLPPILPNEQYYLEYFLSSQFETNINPVLNVYVDNRPVASYNGNLLLGDLERVPLESFLPSTVNIAFTTSYTNNGDVGPRIIAKKIHVRTEHVKPSNSMAAHLKRIQENKKAVVEAKKAGKWVDVRRNQ